MASKKKQSEGIALLSMYNDEEDDEMEDELAMLPEPEVPSVLLESLPPFEKWI